MKFFIPLLFSISLFSCEGDLLTRARQDSIYNDMVRKDSISKKLQDTSLLKLIKVNKNSFLKSVATCRLSKDEFQESKYYYDKSSPKYINRNGIFLYTSAKGPELRFAIQYTATEWLFIRSLIINVDGKNYKYTPNSRFKDDNRGGMIWEWSDQEVDNEDLPMIVAAATGKVVKVRYNGTNYYKDFEMTDKQKLAMYHVLVVYKGFLLGYGQNK